MINVGNIQVREGASIPKAQHGTMTKGLAPAEYNIGIDPLVGPWESLSDLEAYMISSGRKDKQGNPLFINGLETTIVGSDGIPHKYIRSNGAWLAMNYSGGSSNNVTAENVAYDSSETYTSGTVGYAIKQLETNGGGGSSNNVAAEDVSYNASTAYTSGNVGYEIKQIETDLSTRLGGIKSTGHAEDNSGAAIGYTSHALAYRGRQRMYDVANQEYINVIYTNAGTVSVGETTCAIGEFSFAAGQGNNGGGNAPNYYYHVASSYEAGDEYIYLQEEPVGGYLSFKESPYDDPSGDHVAKIVSKSYDGSIWEVRLAEPYIDRNINADNWVYPITGSHGQNSSSFGMHTIAQGDDSTVVGKYNYPMSNELFSVGCGTDLPASARKNALIVLDDGSIYIKGVGNYDGTNAGESGVLSLQDMLSSLGFGNTGSSSGSDPYGSDPYASDPNASDPYGSDPYGSDPYGSDPYGGGY